MTPLVFTRAAIIVAGLVLWVLVAVGLDKIGLGRSVGALVSAVYTLLLVGAVFLIQARHPIIGGAILVVLALVTAATLVYVNAYSRL